MTRQKFELCSSCGLPLEDGPSAREFRVEVGDELVLVGRSCCVGGRTRQEWDEEAAKSDLTIPD